MRVDGFERAVKECSCSHALHIGRDSSGSCLDRGCDAWWQKGAILLPRNFIMAQHAEFSVPSLVPLAVPMEQIGNHIGVSGKIHVTGADGSEQGSWLPLTEWLLSVLRRGSNIVPNSPRATCNLLRRLQHSPLHHQGMLMFYLQCDGIQSPLTSIWHLFFFNWHGFRGFNLCRASLIAFITSTCIIGGCPTGHAINSASK